MTTVGKKRKSALQPWLGTEEQLCRAVKRLQTSSKSRSSSESQGTSAEDSETNTVEGGPAAADCPEQPASVEELTSTFAESACLAPQRTCKPAAIPAKQTRSLDRHQTTAGSGPLPPAAQASPSKRTLRKRPSSTDAKTPAASSGSSLAIVTGEDATDEIAAFPARPTTVLRPVQSVPQPSDLHPPSTKPHRATEPPSQELQANLSPALPSGKATRIQFRALRRTASPPAQTEPRPRLQINTHAGTNGQGQSDDEHSSNDVQEPSTPGREERSPPTPTRPGTLGKRANSSKDMSYEWLYEETNALLKNLHFQRLKRIAGDRET